MFSSGQLTSAYTLPFTVYYVGGQGFSDGGAIHGIAQSRRPFREGEVAVQMMLDLFSKLASTGALCGKGLPPWESRLQFDEPVLAAGNHIAFDLTCCSVDAGALINLIHLFLACQENLSVETLQFFPSNILPKEKLLSNPGRPSMYPGIYESLPFLYINEEPESGAYTFTAQLKEPLKTDCAEMLNSAFKIWANAVRAGAYGLAPIPPQESYAEPYGNGITFFDSTVEWTVFKLRADPACVAGLVNIFGAFHERCQQVVSLIVS